MIALTVDQVMETEGNLGKVMAQALGVGASLPLHFIKKEKGAKVFVSVESDPIDRPGILGLMFSDLRIGSFGSMWILTQDQIDETMANGEDAVFAYFNIHTSYTHQTGGSNGCEIGFCGRNLVAELKVDRTPNYQTGKFGISWTVRVR